MVIDIRICPKGVGQVFLGEPGTDATISSRNGTTGENLTILAGDGSAGDGGSITFTPGDGSAGADGNVCITDADSIDIMCFEGASATVAVSSFTVTNSPTGGDATAGTAPEIKVVSSDSNVDIAFLPKGTGVLSVSGTTTYEDNVTDDDDIPNKAFVDAAIATTDASVHRSLFSVVNDAGTLATTIPVPANADIVRVIVNVTAVYDTVSGFDIGTAAATIRVTDDSGDGFVDWQTTGTYIIEHFETVTGAASNMALSQSTWTSGSGAATIRVEFVLDV